MNKRIAYMRADGGLTISEIMPKERLVGQWGTTNALGVIELSDEEYERRMQEKLQARMTRKGAAKAVTLPANWKPPESDRAFRDAWKLDDQDAVAVDMEKAREIHRDRMRFARKPLLTALDVEYTKADEVRDQAAKDAIAAQRQALRDVTDDPTVDAAATPAELRAAWPADKLGPSPYERKAAIVAEAIDVKAR